MPTTPDTPPEARDWLRGNANEAALAGNRFGWTADALAFVEMLYTAGATGVYVTNIYDEPERITRDGGPYADSLIVVPPTDPARRAAVLALCRAETEREGLEWTDADNSERPVLLWWD